MLRILSRGQFSDGPWAIPTNRQTTPPYSHEFSLGTSFILSSSSNSNKRVAWSHCKINLLPIILLYTALCNRYNDARIMNDLLKTIADRQLSKRRHFNARKWLMRAALRNFRKGRHATRISNHRAPCTRQTHMIVIIVKCCYVV